MAQIICNGAMIDISTAENLTKALERKRLYQRRGLVGIHALCQQAKDFQRVLQARAQQQREQQEKQKITALLHTLTGETE